MTTAAHSTALSLLNDDKDPAAVII